MEEDSYPSGAEGGSELSGSDEKKKQASKVQGSPSRRRHKAPPPPPPAAAAAAVAVTDDAEADVDTSSTNTPTVTSRSRGPGRNTPRRQSSNKSSWVSFFEDLGLFQCGGGKEASRSDEEDTEVYTFDDVPFGAGEESGGCFLFGSNDADLVFSEEQTKTGWSVWTPYTDEDDVIFLRDTSLISLMKTNPTKRAWSSPPRLKNVAVSALQRDDAFKNKQGVVPAILEDVFHFSDMDTFLSDEFTEMELGYFNGLYDQICKPLVTRRRSRAKKPLSCFTLRPSSVVLSFDDTISKLTIDDGKSLSTASLTTMENLMKTAVDKATIAAIVKAQAKGGWRSKSQEEAEAKAEQLSRFGVERTYSGSVGASLQEHTEVASDNVIIVHHYGDEASQVEAIEQPWKDLQSTFFRSPSNLELEDKVEDHTEIEEDEYELEDTKETGPSKSDSIEDTKETGPSKSDSRRRFLKAFSRRKKKKSKSDTMKAGKSPSKSKRSWGLMTPPRKPRQRDIYAPSPTSTTMTGPCSVSMAGENTGENARRNTGEAKTPSEIGEVEVLSKQREPVYTSYIRTVSNKSVENIEILREESITAEFEADFTELESVIQHQSDAEFTTELESVTQDGLHSHDVLETVTEEVMPEAFAPWELKKGGGEQLISDDASVPALGDLDDEEETSSHSSLEPPSLTKMLSRLSKESENEEKLRVMMEKNDEILGELKEFLQSNESAAVLERVNSSGSTLQSAAEH